MTNQRVIGVVELRLSFFLCVFVLVFQFQQKVRVVMGDSNAEVCEGALHNDKPHGNGKIMWDRSVYGGELKDRRSIRDRFEGKGESADGSVYDGKFLGSKRHGIGVSTWANGDTYTGEWVHDKRHGKGVMKWADGSAYNGEWVHGKRHGIGVLTRANGSVYNVEGKDGKAQTASSGKLWFRRVSDLTVRGMVARFGQPESTPAFAIIIVLFCLKLLMKNAQSTVGQNQPEFTRHATLIGAPTPQDPQADGAFCVAVLLTEHRECSICYESFSTYTDTADENIREKLPVQSRTCRHYFCHGCILRAHAQRATSRFGVVPERISCFYCSAEDAFCPTQPNYHWMLLDLLQRSTTVGLRQRE